MCVSHVVFSSGRRGGGSEGREREGETERDAGERRVERGVRVHGQREPEPGKRRLPRAGHPETLETLLTAGELVREINTSNFNSCYFSDVYRYLDPVTEFVGPGQSGNGTGY